MFVSSLVQYYEGLLHTKHKVEYITVLEVLVYNAHSSTLLLEMVCRGRCVKGERREHQQQQKVVDTQTIEPHKRKQDN